MPTSTPKPERVSRTYTIDKSINDKLQQEADRRRIAPSLLVEWALGVYLPMLPPLPGDQEPDTEGGS